MTEPDAAPETGTVADAVRGNWVDRLAPAAARPYLRLSRADRPIGTWLLLLALLVGGAAGGGRDRLVADRCLGDRRLRRRRLADARRRLHLERHHRPRYRRPRRPHPLAADPLGPGVGPQRQALSGWRPRRSSPSRSCSPSRRRDLARRLSLALIAIYPFAKRFTWWPQVFLGLAFNWGALLAYAAVTGRLSGAALALYLSGIAWTLFYDTIYAHQDKDDDALIGVKSTARLFGARTRDGLRWFMAADRAG